MRRRITLFMMAGGLSIWCALSARPGEDEAVEVPFTFEHHEIVVQVKMSRRGPFAMMVDTDTDPSTIHLPFAQSSNLKLREVRGGEVTGGGSERPKVYLTKLERVELGALPARDVDAVAIDLSKIQDRLGPVQGVLGHNFLAGRVVQIDYPAKMLRFYRSSAAVPVAKSGGTSLPFRIGEDADILIEGITINGKSATATVDTGSDGTFSLTPAAVEALGLTVAASHGQAETSAGYKGTSQNTRGKVDRIAIGSIEVASPEVVFWGKGGGRGRRPWDLDIGNAFLQDYIVTIDYLKKRLALSPAKLREQ